MSHFGPYNPNGLTFDFNFHHVTRIEVTAKNDCTTFATRDIILYDANDRAITIKCFTHDSHDLPLTVEPDPWDNQEEI